MTVRVPGRLLALRPLLSGVLFLFLSLSILSGCSISKSVESISDSISSPSDWSKSSSGSSSGGGGGGGDPQEAEEPETQQDAQSYSEDVTQLAYTYGKQGGDIGALRNGVSGLATKRGITNWEVDSVTCQSIGKGVGKAGMSEEGFTKFSQQLFGQDLMKANELRKGYDVTKPPSASAAQPAGATPAESGTADPQAQPDASSAPLGN